MKTAEKFTDENWDVIWQFRPKNLKWTKAQYRLYAIEMTKAMRRIKIPEDKK